MRCWGDEKVKKKKRITSDSTQRHSISGIPSKRGVGSQSWPPATPRQPCIRFAAHRGRLPGYDVWARRKMYLGLYPGGTVKLESFQDRGSSDPRWKFVPSGGFPHLLVLICPGTLPRAARYRV